MTTNIGIKDSNRQAVAQELDKLLADEYVLIIKTRNAHWNIEDIDFYNKHKFFESQYQVLDVIIDNIAERIRALGHYAIASLKQFLALTHLAEINGITNQKQAFLKELLADHESIIINLRENIHRFAGTYHDVGTSDFITGLMEEHEKMAWMLRAHIE